MLSRKPTAIKLTQEDIQDYDNSIAQQQQQEHSPEAELPSQPVKGAKGKESAATTGVTAQERQRDMDERIGVGGAAAGRGGRQ
jgi:Anaphase-promoting complex APC subunit CDC26